MANIRPWIVDAAHISEISSTNPISLLHRTNIIDEFLDNPNKSFISATKGIGKTFLLKIKSHYIRNNKKGSLFIPKVDLVDKVGASRSSILSESVYGQYVKLEVHEQLCHYAFILTIIRNSPELLEDIWNKNSNFPEGLLPHQADYPTVKDIYGSLLSDYNLFRDLSFGHFFDTFEISLRNYNLPIYIFIDNVDEFYGNTEGVYYEDLWFIAQIALLKSVVKLTDDYKHLHIYSTIRKKALDRLSASDDQMDAQLMDSVVKLTYTKRDLKRIFINNIKAERDERLTTREELQKNPIKAFVGFDQIENRFISGEKEKLFDYIYRHTLGRPRDLMRMGDAISLMETSQRSVGEVRATINEMALKNGQQYLKEVNQFMQINLEENIYERIDTNILSQKEIADICCEANKESSRDCMHCIKHHIFCTLHSYGLLGHEYKNNANKQCTQHFTSAGKQPTYDVDNTLPASPRYFIHPCLSEVIDDYRTKQRLEPFNPNRTTIVGYDAELKCTVEHKFPQMIKAVEGFEIAKYPITSEEYYSYLNTKDESNLYLEQKIGDKKPITKITYSDAINYCNWLGEETGDSYRLPTVEEWEACCQLDKDRADAIWHRDNSKGEIQVVGIKEPNIYGIYDMLGNVWEWCSNDYEKEENKKLLKGGSYKDALGTLDCLETTGSFDKDQSDSDIGFRVVKEIVKRVQRVSSTLSKREDS